MLNDGGLKVPEFIRFAPVIKEDDFMMTHDYYTKGRTSAGGIIIMEDVDECIIGNDLELCYESIFNSALWLCVKKRM